MSRTHYDFYVYIMASESGVLYIGVTNDIIRRVEEHKDGANEGFTKKYKCKNLVYYEHYNDINQAIFRETEIKKWHREKKVDIIKSINPLWKDLYSDWVN